MAHSKALALKNFYRVIFALCPSEKLFLLFFFFFPEVTCKTGSLQELPTSHGKVSIFNLLIANSFPSGPAFALVLPSALRLRGAHHTELIQPSSNYTARRFLCLLFLFLTFLRIMSVTCFHQHGSDRYGRCTMFKAIEEACITFKNKTILFCWFCRCPGGRSLYVWLWGWLTKGHSTVWRWATRLGAPHDCHTAVGYLPCSHIPRP